MDFVRGTEITTHHQYVLDAHPPGIGQRVGEVAPDDVPGYRVPAPAKLTGDVEGIPAVFQEVEDEEVTRGTCFQIGTFFQCVEKRQDIEGKTGCRSGMAVFCRQIVVTPAAADWFTDTGHESFERYAG